MEQVVTNLSGRTRRATIGGREYIVAPLSLIVPGVLNGSKGPLYYPAEEIAKDPSVWNHVPIVVYHPISNGQHISARDPDVLESQGIGIVLRAVASDSRANGRLTAEGWFDVQNMGRVDERILIALEQGKSIELSTGLFTDNVPADEGAAFNGTPYTHIARNYRPDHLAILPDQVGACSIEDGCGVLVNQDKQAFDKRLGESLGITNKVTKKETSMDREKIIADLITNNCCWEEGDRGVLNELSDEHLGRLKAEVDREAADGQALELVANAAREGFTDSGGSVHVYNEEKKTWESKMKKEVPTGNDGGKKDKPQTAEEWMESAPADIRSAVRNAMDIEQQEKAKLIKQLTANLKDDAHKRLTERLQAKPLSELRDLILLAPVQEETAGIANYFGAAAPATSDSSDFDENDVLPLPTMNWTEETGQQKQA